ncbi:MAG: hypothetical protein ABFE07_17485 [Armatimonadia bacterium]
MPTTAAIYFDRDLQASANAGGRNYWHVYTRELCAQMGLTTVDVTRSKLRAGDLGAARVLILPDLTPQYLRPEEKETLRQWVEQGGLLIGFATGGLGELFGVKVEDTLPQPDDAFTPAAAIRYKDAELARPLLPAGEEDTPIPVISPVKLLGQVQGRELAGLLNLYGRDLRRPAVTLREVGRGRAVYFCFNVAQTAWALHHGRPVLEDYDGDGKLRMSDAMVTRPFPTDLPYADMLLYLLRNLIARQGLPLVHALPPTDEGEVPDALFFYGGDDEGTPTQQVASSEIMRELGLPYHINIMPDPEGNFGLSRTEFEQIKANGHEPSLHFNFIAGVEHPYAFNRADIQRQVNWYRKAFGETPVCTVFHWVTWCGWTEPAEWLAGAGILADNSRFPRYFPPSNPVNHVGFAFGTAMPFFHYSDWRKENDRIRCLGIPITGYEVGYEKGRVDLTQFRRAVDLARFWHIPMDLFCHPFYLVTHPECVEGLRQGLQYMDEIGLRALHYGPDRVTKWWLARSEARVEEVEIAPEGTSFSVQCQWESGCVVQKMIGAEEPQVLVDGQSVKAVVREEHGARWLFVAVPQGAHDLEIGTN